MCHSCVPTYICLSILYLSYIYSNYSYVTEPLSIKFIYGNWLDTYLEPKGMNKCECDLRWVDVCLYLLNYLYVMMCEPCCESIVYLGTYYYDFLYASH